MRIKTLLLVLIISSHTNGYAAIKDTAVCALQDLSLYAGETAGDTYQWQIQREGYNSFMDLRDNIIYSNVQSDTLFIINLPSYLSGARFRCAVTSGSTTVYSDTFSIRIKATWTGTTGSNWRNKENWECGAIPDEYTEVEVPSTQHTQGYDLNIYTDLAVKKITVLPEANVKVDTPAYVIIWGKKVWVHHEEPVQQLVEHHIWRGYRGYIGDANLEEVNYYNTEYGDGCLELGDEYFFIDSLHMVFNPDSTGYLRFYNHEWGTEEVVGGTCFLEQYDRYAIYDKAFIWGVNNDPQKITITFEGGLASEDEGPLEFDILATHESLLHIYSVMQPLPDDLYFNVIFR